MSQHFEVHALGGSASIEIMGNTITALFPDRERNHLQTRTVEIPRALVAAMHDLETFSTRSTFTVETDEAVELDEQGRECDIEHVIKLFDDVHGGGLVWFLVTDEVIWGTARGKLTVLPDGTILRDDTISSGLNRLGRMI